MKLTKEQKELRKDMLQEFRNSGGMLFADGFSGLTVAVLSACGSANPKFYYVASSQCDNVDDGFKQKIGEYLALIRLMWSQHYCTVPANGRSIHEIGESALDFFTVD